MPPTATAAAAPRWVRSSTAPARPPVPTPPTSSPIPVPPAAACSDARPVVPASPATAASAVAPAAGTTPVEEVAEAIEPAADATPESDAGQLAAAGTTASPAPASNTPARLPEVLPTVGSPDGRLVLTGEAVTVLGQTFGLRGLERADVQHVRWVLWVLLGALGLAAVLIAFLQNWLRTLPAAAGLLLTAALLAYGQRGTNRLRLWQLSPSPLHFALPGELATWQRLVAELNRRIARAHDHAAAEAAALLAAAEAEAARQADEAEATADPPPAADTQQLPPPA